MRLHFAGLRRGGVGAARHVDRGGASRTWLVQAAAGNLALTFGAKGGIYIAGGVIPRFQEFFINSGFRSKFEDKGRFVSYLQPIPVFIVVRSNLGLLGAAKKLQQI